MGRSRRVLFVLLAATAPAAIACNAILGIDEFKRTECGVDPCPFDGGPDVVADDFVPDGGGDAKTDAPPGIGPVSWADFEMPNYKEDAGLSPTARPLKYTVSGEVAQDDYTQLPWQRSVVGQTDQKPFGDDHTQDSARAACQGIPNGPWRLPKRIELVTLLSYGMGAPFIDRDVFRVPAVRVWTSSEVRPLDGKYWAIDFETGALVQLDGKTQPAKALCVKDKP